MGEFSKEIFKRIPERILAGIPKGNLVRSNEAIPRGLIEGILGGVPEVIPERIHDGSPGRKPLMEKWAKLRNTFVGIPEEILTEIAD